MMLQQNTKTASAASAIAASEQANEFLTFRLGAEEYGIEILKVQEIRGWEQPTTIANSPDFIKGVINLRGTIVPIVDMRIKFGLDEADYNALTVVIILNVANRVVGMVVDAVSDVITLSGEQIRPAPQFGTVLDMQHIVGLGTVENRMLILLDIEKLMCSTDMALMDGSPVQ
ncbi:MAG: chemotaxis protein CheW [Burkholderiales bacterium]|nr:chemotaxis protein CheW [Burkholderiales bacterium]MDP2399232.1 chemotaxis protein CheW [Burkholderiales bacterium]